jgi:hypothetical protein
MRLTLLVLKTYCGLSRRAINRGRAPGAPGRTRADGWRGDGAGPAPVASVIREAPAELLMFLINSLGAIDL